MKTAPAISQRKFNVGDQVVLTTYSPPMLIVAINSTGTYRCQWLDQEHRIQSADWPEGCLVEYDMTDE